MTARMSALKALGALVLTTATLLGLAASAHADLYWANLDTNTIGRSTLTGASANQSFITPSTALGGGLAVDAGHVYWASWWGYIGRADLDGGNVDDTWIGTAVSVSDVVVDSQYVYWAYANDGHIGRAKIDGTEVEPEWLWLGDDAADSIALTSTHIYFTIPGNESIGRANLDGSNRTLSLISGLDNPLGLATDGTYLYWADFGEQAIGRATLAGTSVDRYFIDPYPSRPAGVATAGGKVFWSEPHNNAIGSANLNGSGGAYIASGSFPRGLAATAPTFSVSPTTKNFGSSPVNKPGPQQTFTVTNTASGPTAAPLVFAAGAVTLTGGAANQFALSGNTCANQSIAPGASCSVTVTFNPTSGGSKTTTLRFASNAATSPNTVSLSGQATTPTFAATPSSVNYGSAVVGGDPVTQDVSIRNSATGVNAGTLDIPADGVTLAGTDPGDFSIIADACSGASLASDVSCTVTVAFSPGAAGARSAQLRVVSSAATSPNTVALGGEGTLPFAVAPGTLTFGGQLVGTGSPAQPVTITNTGAADRTINNVTVVGADAGEFVRFAGACIGTTLAPGASCSASVAFRPTSAGAKAAQLRVLSGGATSDVALAGTGLAAPALTFTPAAKDFGSVDVGGSSAAQPFVVTNAGGAAVTVRHAELAGADAGDFARFSGGCINVALAPGDSCTISALFRPQSPGAKTAQINVTTTAGPPQTIDLSGTAASTTVLVFDPASWSFGDQKVGRSSATKAFTVTNGAATAVTITHSNIVGPDAADFVRFAGACLNLTLAPGDSCTFTALFRPQSPGAKTAQIKLTVAGRPHQLLDVSGFATAT